MSVLKWLKLLAAESLPRGSDFDSSYERMGSVLYNVVYKFLPGHI